MFNILGKMPAGDSVAGKLNGLDLKKTLRLAIVVFLGAFCVKIAGAGDLSAVTDLHQVFVDALNAGVMALGSAAIELVRRLATNQSV